MHTPDCCTRAFIGLETDWTPQQDRTETKRLISVRFLGHKHVVLPTQNTSLTDLSRFIIAYYSFLSDKGAASMRDSAHCSYHEHLELHCINLCCSVYRPCDGPTQHPRIPTYSVTNVNVMNAFAVLNKTVNIILLMFPFITWLRVSQVAKLPSVSV
jgi:multisubunit Na+/H+ antiporter MnhF subunit